MQLVSRGDFHMFFGELSEAHLKRFLVWCEYYEPKELDDFPQLTPVWLRENLFSKMEQTNSHPLYATDRHIDFQDREFLSAAAEIRILKNSFSGYLFLSQGQPITARIFSDCESLALYSNDLFGDENTETMGRLLGGETTLLPQQIELSYHFTSDKIDWLSRSGTLWIPVSQDRAL
ncbi:MULTISPECIES: hypothetical protein [Kordiimonas]|jgi:hypothetical protein|uniref:hypothetical protein n=1 Tax=Kordiimonas TaxID=288021 RepID=UPI00257BF16E|nr:hypothetical protein [Kordiimonas sp. UBA4487]